MSQQNSESFEANLGSGTNNFAKLDGGAMIVSANISDMNNMRLTGPTHLHEVGFTGLGTGLLAGRDTDKSGTDKTSEINVGFDHISLLPERSTGFDRWPFMQTKNDESLHEKISDKVKEGMDPKDRTDLEKQEKEYKKAFDSWSTKVGIGLNPPELDDYPLLKDHLQKVSAVEKGITHKVLDGLTQDEKDQLKAESNPLGPGFAPKPMSDKVVEKIREATRKYLDSDNQVSQREHNKA